MTIERAVRSGKRIVDLYLEENDGEYSQLLKEARQDAAVDAVADLLHYVHSLNSDMELVVRRAVHHVRYELIEARLEKEA